MRRIRLLALLVAGLTTAMVASAMSSAAQLPPIPIPLPTDPPPPQNQPAPGSPPPPPPKASPRPGPQVRIPGVKVPEAVERTTRIPGSLLRARASVRRTGPNNTRRLLQLLEPLYDLGVPHAEVIKMGFGRFPMGGLANYGDDWLAFRRGPPVHLHEGTDIFAAFRVPVRAPADGILRHSGGGLGGISVYVTEPNGTYYYMAHLQGYPKGQRSGQHVRVGDVVGYNGDSGNARGGSPHVHFEVHPRGGGPVNPKPILDDWLTEAMANATNLVASFESGRPRVLISTGLTRALPDGSDGRRAEHNGPSRTELLWAASANPGGGPLRLAEAEATAAIRHVDWSELAREAQARVDEERRADMWARTVLARLTPLALHSYLELAVEDSSSL